MTRSASRDGFASTTHTAFVAAPPRAVYQLIADVTRWPCVFAPTVHVERLERMDDETERLRVWAIANGATRGWISRRTLDPEGLRVRFTQERPLPPVLSMAGEWVLVPLPGNATSVVLLHEFQAIDDDPGHVALITQTIDRTATMELAAVKGVAELGERLPRLVRSFSETAEVAAPLDVVYEFLSRAQDWPGRLPHVSRLLVDEAAPLQTVEMDTRDGDGAVRTTRSIRLCFPQHSIVYKQIELPADVAAHVGGWYLEPIDGGVRVTARSTLMLSPERLGDALWPNASMEQAAILVEQALRRNCVATLRSAQETLCRARVASVPAPRPASARHDDAPLPTAGH
ncbi:MAG TPA: aromatase/cyclase [Pseudonocardiaceae bacterium]